MKKKLCLLLVVFIMLTSLTTYGQVLDQEKLTTDLDFMKNVINFVIDKYNYEVDQDDIVNGLYDGFFGVLDEYSVYYTEEEYKSLITDTAGEFVGIGVQITDVNGQIVVLTPLPNSPAIEVGIKNGDIIKYVDDKDVSGLTSSEAASLIKGKEGTHVKIGIIRDNKPLNFDIIRRTVVTSSVEGKILDNNIGYLKITSFAENTPELVMKELSIFDEKNIEKIIIDLRNNGGGTLNSAVELLNLFVTEGPVLYVDYANGQEDVYSCELAEQKYELALLINGGSASATEIFAGAVKYKNEGILVGTKSFGKGIVQSLYQLNNGSGVKFTTAEYFSVDKKPVHKVGITPDIIIENPEINLSKYPTFSKENKPSLGNVSLDVLAAEMILETLEYKIDKPDGVYDNTSFAQIKNFQKDNNLYPYGTIDIATQNALYQALVSYSSNKLVDLQLETAIEQLLK